MILDPVKYEGMILKKTLMQLWPQNICLKNSHWKILDEVLKKRRAIYPAKTTKNK